jgi:hypothetical protein
MPAHFRLIGRGGDPQQVRRESTHQMRVRCRDLLERIRRSHAHHGVLIREGVHELRNEARILGNPPNHSRNAADGPAVATA